MTTSNDSMSTVQDGNSTNSSRLYPHPAQEVVMWVAPLLDITLNLLVFVVVPRIKTLRVSTTVGMVSLAVTDLALGIMGLTGVIYSRYTGFKLQTDHALCFIISHALYFFAGVSIVMLTYLNVDRFLAFLYPLSYQLTRKRVIIINIVIWVAVLSLQLPNMIMPKGYKYFEHAFMCLPNRSANIIYKAVGNVAIFLIPSIMNMVSFCGSFYLIRSRHKRLSAGASSVRVHYGGEGSDNSDSQWSRDRRLFKVLSIMTFGFYITWLPYAITISLPEDIIGSKVQPITDFITPWLAASSSFWNPIIYMLTMRPFTVALSALCRNTLCGRYICKRTGASVERPTSSPGSGTTDTGDCTNVAQEQRVVQQTTRI